MAALPDGANAAATDQTDDLVFRSYKTGDRLLLSRHTIGLDLCTVTLDDVLRRCLACSAA